MYSVRFPDKILLISTFNREREIKLLQRFNSNSMGFDLTGGAYDIE